MILVAFGTRPEIIKLFPVIRELKKRQIPHMTLFSGQQIDLYEDVRDLVPAPDYSFTDLFMGAKKNNTLGQSYNKICEAAENLFNTTRFDMVMVQGDTTTAWALAQSAFYNNIPVAHVEAGLRTHDIMNPFPEEANRSLIARIAQLNFAPTKQAALNLEREGAKNIHVVGNTIVDAVNHFKQKMAWTPRSSNKVLVTLHRRENHVFMGHLFDEIRDIALANPDLEFIIPLHPNPSVQEHRSRLSAANVSIVKPFGYEEMLTILNEACFIITDSGGIQEEASCFNKKVLVVREKTERPEIIAIGLGRLVGKSISPSIPWARVAPPPLTESPYGDGTSAIRIVEVLAGGIKEEAGTTHNGRKGR
ncbi:MAG: UDP-N-acetylglucosamine 2-epimerase (non-hydrolyzing) [Syntrophales bacterium LBB04]|nr:UDP-N-acetylglucosamine 2-epimerase (non-hydrolyzing) [Syntrophales bacterium LBB04]